MCDRVYQCTDCCK
ncbi:hypothetical protein NPIL_464281, partial [Nephila pilipes]